MLWRDTQLRVSVLGVDAAAWGALLLPALHLRLWTLGVAFGFIVVNGVVRVLGVTTGHIALYLRMLLIGRIRPTLQRPTVWRARMRRFV